MTIYQLASGTAVPDLLGPDGHIRLMPAADFDTLPWDGLRLWCHQHARYGLVTQELVGWLREFVGDRSAIEIGSGHGDLAHHVGITGTDNRCQTFPDVQMMYRMSGQPLIQYPPWVRWLEALEAVRQLEPDVVIGSWITHWIDPDLPPPPGGGSVYGVREDELLDTGVTYVMIGNLSIHQHKPILSRPHEELALPFLRSRSVHPELDRIFIWHGR